MDNLVRIARDKRTFVYQRSLSSKTRNKVKKPKGDGDNVFLTIDQQNQVAREWITWTSRLPMLLPVYVVELFRE